MITDLYAAKLARNVYNDFNIISYDSLVEAHVFNDRSYIYIVFNGSNRCSDWFGINLQIYRLKIKDKGRVVLGFLQGFGSVLDKIKIELHRIRQKCPYSSRLPIITIGYSSGGAMAYLAADEFNAYACYTFGAPKVVDNNYANLLEHKIPIIKTFILKNDLVPHFPLFHDFRTVGKLIKLKSANKIPLIEHSMDNYINAIVKSTIR
jgi:hypothetical protein